MKAPQKYKSISDVEDELNIIISCNRKPKYDLSIYQIMNFIAEFIELSIQSADQKRIFNTWHRIIGKYKFAKLMSSGFYSKASQVYGFPSKAESGDEKSAEMRLRTALTAFKLHSGPFGSHPIYGDLDKKQWEKVISILSGFLFGYIHLEGDEKARFLRDKELQKEKHEKRKQDQKESKYLSDKNSKNHKHNNRNKNRNWKNKKRHHKKDNRNQGEGAK
ncbi:four helix bundle metalloprotein [Leptospira ryugenii]|uniref:Four helix bundle metalloprotein n=1 Tax=Leptospira ryugenii TaxID=1917863 RepID=A0A2P2E4U6_9LEPT|nr:DUF1569 domain-containing protein [Leptospira ryugenii]GBF51905.1 four helix bundle metalloprotein [Leptospira ryugenii]